MTHAASDAHIVAELFYEQEHPVISGAYKHGYLRTPITVARALFSRHCGPDLDASLQSGKTVAIVFFENEYQAAAKVRSVLSIDAIVRLDIKRLSVIRRTLGIRRLVGEIAYFCKEAVRRRGPRAFATLGVPMLGWLLFKSLETALHGLKDMRIVTTNMQHPLSVGAHHAAKSCQMQTVYLEHASTTSSVFNDRGYDLFVVDLPHTRSMLERLGIASDRIRLLRNSATLKAVPVPRPLSTVGVCVNDLDSVESVLRVVTVLRELGIRVTLRLHDSDRRIDAFRKMANDHGASFSSARESRIEAFFGTVDLVVAGNSNVLADALREGKPTIYFWDGADNVFDYYGLAAHYALPCARRSEDLRLLLANSSSGS